MNKKFTFSCVETNERHTKFVLRDPSRAHCGEICILTDDVPEFIGRHNWQGNINWNGLVPKSLDK